MLQSLFFFINTNRMSNWITSSGLLTNLDRGELANISLQYNSPTNASINFNIISGSLPSNLILSNANHIPILHYPSIYGIIPTNENSGNYSFTIRANSNNIIDDRTFSLIINDDETSNIFPNSNLGIFSDGLWASTNISSLYPFNSNISLINGSIPSNLTLNTTNGIISGYVNPNNLYTTPTSNGYNSANTKTFSFTVGYDANIIANYSMTIMRADLYANSNANVQGPVYHAPIFLDSNFYNNSNTANINLDTICDSPFYYQFVTKDFENNTVNFKLINGPDNVTLNSNTGWLVGDISNLGNSSINFEVVAYKANANSYQTIMPVNFTIQSSLEKNIQWNTSSNLGNINTGVPSTVRVNAEVIKPFLTPIDPIVTTTLKLVGGEIVNGGSNFSIGDIKQIEGGILNSPANIIVSNTSNGIITSISIQSGEKYSELPILKNVVWENANGYNAILNLDFGIDSVIIENSGLYCDSATIGFDDAGQTKTGKAKAYIVNNSLYSVAVTETGNNYTTIPKTTVRGLNNIFKSNPIKYSLIAGQLPDGLKLLSNGMIVGIPNSVKYPLSNGNVYNFTVEASIGRNKPINFTENDLIGPSNVIIQDNQTLVCNSKDFSINVTTSKSIPQSNLSLEFLLNDIDYNTLFDPLHNESIISNSDIYRNGDFYYGIQDKARMLMAYGIPPVSLNTVMETLNKYHQNKTFLLTNLKWAISTTNNYEVIYIQPIDEYTDIQGNTFLGNINKDNLLLYPATIPNMIDRIESTLGPSDDNFLPTWMTDVQPNTNSIIGFISVIPLVYVKVGCGKRVLYYLQKYYDTIGPSLNTIKTQSDRYVWNYGFIENWNIANNTWNSYSNSFTCEDEGSIYMKFPNKSLKDSYN